MIVPLLDTGWNALQMDMALSALRWRNSDYCPRVLRGGPVRSAPKPHQTACTSRLHYLMHVRRFIIHSKSQKRALLHSCFYSNSYLMLHSCARQLRTRCSAAAILAATLLLSTVNAAAALPADGSLLHTQVSPTVVSINLTAPAHSVDERFLSICFDLELFSPASSWGFFTSSRSLAAVGALAPAYMRVSGTAVDSITFNATAACGTTCLNATQVDSILRFAALANVSLVLGINGRLGRTQADPDAPFDYSNAAALLDHLAVSGFPTAAFELGNEPDLWFSNHNTSGAALAEGVAVLRTLLAARPSLQSSVFGPDTCECWHGDKLLTEYVAALNGTGTSTHALPGLVTVHFYNRGGRVQPEDMLNISTADTLLNMVATTRTKMADSGNAAAATVPLALGETGECVMGGCASVNGSSHEYYSEGFLDNFLFADKLGLAAALNVSVVFKEKIIGGNDGVLNPLLFPEPPYWLALMHKQLVGARILGVSGSTEPSRSVRVYAHCARRWGATGDAGGTQLVPTYPPGAIVLLAINLDLQKQALLNLTDVNGQPLSSVPRDEYRLSGRMPAPLPGNDTACAFGPQPHKLPYLPEPTCLNGALLYLSDGPACINCTLPQLQPATVSVAGPIVLPPASVAVFVLPDAAAAACS